MIYSDVKKETVPVKKLSLVFPAASLEKNYRDSCYEQSIRLVRSALLIGVIIHLVYLYVDTLILDRSHFIFWMARLTACVPLLIITFLISYHRIYKKHHQKIIALNVLINNLVMVFGAYWYQGETTVYFCSGFIMVTMFAYFLLGMRVGNAFRVTFISLLVATVVLIVIPIDLSQFVIALQEIVVSSAVLSIGAYNTEKISRTAFLQSRKLIAQEISKKESEYARITWLENMTGFLRHELRNAVTGVKTSLELLRRRHEIDLHDKYLKRAGRGVRIISRLLESVGDATSIESSFIKESTERVAMNKLLSDQVDHYSVIYPEVQIDYKTDTIKIFVQGNESRIIQVLDNLVNNAVDHCDKQSPIMISLSRQHDDCILSVANKGNPLPEEKEAIFDLFSSFRKDEDETVKRGFGLYIVRLICERYGGRVEAKEFNNNAGAEFVVSLPALG